MSKSRDRAPKSLEDRSGCEICHAGYITFICFATDDGSKDICSSCHLDICRKRGKPSGGYRRPSSSAAGHR